MPVAMETFSFLTNTSHDQQQAFHAEIQKHHGHFHVYRTEWFHAISLIEGPTSSGLLGRASPPVVYFADTGLGVIQQLRGQE